MSRSKRPTPARRPTRRWRTYEVPCGHDVMIDEPDRLTDILLEVL